MVGLNRKVRNLVDKWHRKGRLGYIRYNAKTLLCIDLSNRCPKEECGSPCLYCYKADLYRRFKRFSKELTYGDGVFRLKELLIFLKELRSILSPHMDYFSFRAFSFSDVRRRDIPFLRSVFSCIRRFSFFRLHVITKQHGLIKKLEDYVDNIQLSVDFHGVHLSNALKAAKTEKYKVRAVVLNEAELERALNTPEIDIVTLFHGTKKRMREKGVKVFGPSMGAGYGKMVAGIKSDKIICCQTGHCLSCRRCWS